MQLANKCNLFSYAFVGANQETQGIIPKSFQILAKKPQGFEKTQGYEALLGLSTGPPKSAQKTSLT